MLPPSLRWTGEQLELLDQRRLPHDVAILPLRHWRDVAEAIATMAVRGAPAIGVAAAWGVVMAARAGDDLEEAIAVLRASRPTAVNLGGALDRMRSSTAARPPVDPVALQDLAETIEAEDRRLTMQLVQHGVGLLSNNCRVLHHCHTGAIATAGVGTALGVITEAHQQGLLRHAWLDETRPRLQGAGLSAWELGCLGVPCTVIVDGASGLLMRRGEVDAVLVGCDRVAANGDVANKVGTYNLALVARAHGIPFYVCAPGSSMIVPPLMVMRSRSRSAPGRDHHVAWTAIGSSGRQGLEPRVRHHTGSSHHRFGHGVRHSSTALSGCSC